MRLQIKHIYWKPQFDWYDEVNKFLLTLDPVNIVSIEWVERQIGEEDLSSRTSIFPHYRITHKIYHE